MLIASCFGSCDRKKDNSLFKKEAVEYYDSAMSIVNNSETLDTMITGLKNLDKHYENDVLKNDIAKFKQFKKVLAGTVDTTKESATAELKELMILMGQKRDSLAVLANNKKQELEKAAPKAKK